MSRRATTTRTRSHGARLFAPDCVKETFRDHTDLIAGEDGDRAMRCVEWKWDPDPNDSTFITDYVFALREKERTAVHHDQHTEGLFSRETWLRLLESVGFTPEIVECTLDGQRYETFLGRRL